MDSSAGSNQSTERPGADLLQETRRVVDEQSGHTEDSDISHADHSLATTATLSSPAHSDTSEQFFSRKLGGRTPPIRANRQPTPGILSK